MEKVHSLKIEDIARTLKASVEEGLSEDEARERLNRYGKNLLQEFEKKSWINLLIRQFLSPMIYLLSAAALISIFMKEYLDGAAILVVIVINGLIGFFTEFRAEKSLEALRSMISPISKVIREGKIKQIKSEELVPGDVILLEAGDIIPADARLFRSYNLTINEASLTGESLPVEKATSVLPEGTVLPDRTNCVYAGTAVVKGTGRALVWATGSGTEFGEIGTMLQNVKANSTPLEDRLARFSKFLVCATMGIAVVVILLGVLQGRGILKMVETGIALAVAAVPEGLPFVATMTLAIGVRRMALQHALVRNLSSVETLGSTTVICTDKTGTLTMNDMAVRTIESGPADDSKLLVRTAILCNDGELFPDGNKDKGIGDPMDVALLRYVTGKGYDYKKIRSAFPRLGEEPFDSVSKRMVTLHEAGIAMKGAPERIINLVAYVFSADGKLRHIKPADKELWLKKVERLASKGMRILAFSWGSKLDEMIFLGLAGMDDPPRPEVAEAIEQCRDAGIHVIMITGDHLDTANAIASEIGIFRDTDSGSLSGSEIDNITVAQLSEKMKNIFVVARVSPENKLQIVRGLQNNGEVVAMTGDGVNDAVALKQADVGISMGIQGTEVSKEASDIILQDDRFNTIVNAISEGRRIFDNIRKAILFLLCCNLSEVLTVFLSILLKLPSVLLPLQILWINLATDVLPALALALDPAGPDIMRRQPQKKEEEIITSRHKFQISVYGILMTMGVMGVYLWELKIRSGEPVMATEMGFHTLVLSQLLFVINVREESILRNPMQLYSNSWLLGGILLSMILQIAITYIPVFQMILKITPLEVEEWGIVLSGALLPTVVAQLKKILEEART